MDSKLFLVFSFDDSALMLERSFNNTTFPDSSISFLFEFIANIADACVFNASGNHLCVLVSVYTDPLENNN